MTNPCPPVGARVRVGLEPQSGLDCELLARGPSTAPGRLLLRMAASDARGAQVEMRALVSLVDLASGTPGAIAEPGLTRGITGGGATHACGNVEASTHNLASGLNSDTHSVR